MDWKTASEELAKPLDKKAVKPPAKFGPKGSYIEGWHAIAEANRIFGFNGWNDEILMLDCVAEKPRKIGREQKDGWGVTYRAKVRVVVDLEDGTAVARDGCGAGHGYDLDLGLAHESAMKEAETDAFKRAIRTFGWPFGLALYDKAQEHVGTPERNADMPDAKQLPPQPEPPKTTPEASIGMSLDTAQSEEALLAKVDEMFQTWSPDSCSEALKNKAATNMRRLGLDVKSTFLAARARWAAENPKGKAA